MVTVSQKINVDYKVGEFGVEPNACKRLLVHSYEYESKRWIFICLINVPSRWAYSP